MARIATPFLSYPDKLFPDDSPSFGSVVAGEFTGGFVDTDGDDAALLALGALLDSDTSTLGDLDGFLTDADFVAGAFDSDEVSPVLAGLGAMVETGGGLLDDFLASFGPNAGV